MDNLPPFVEVEWDDAWKAATDDATMENAGDSHRPIKCFTRGWMLRDDEKGVQLANERSPDGTFRGRTFVPRPMVIDVSPWPKPKPKRVRKTPLNANKPADQHE